MFNTSLRLIVSISELVCRAAAYTSPCLIISVVYQIIGALLEAFPSCILSKEAKLAKRYALLRNRIRIEIWRNWASYNTLAC